VLRLPLATDEISAVVGKDYLVTFHLTNDQSSAITSYC